MESNLKDDLPQVQPGDELLKLDNQLCFVLYAASRAMTKLYRPLLDNLGLTYPQYIVLLALWQWRLEDPDRLVFVKELGERLYLDSGTLTPLLKRMEQNGLLVRARSAEDERGVTIQLTDKAMDLKKDAVSIPKTLVCDPTVPFTEMVAVKQTLETFLHRVHKVE